MMSHRSRQLFPNQGYEQLSGYVVWRTRATHQVVSVVGRGASGCRPAETSTMLGFRIVDRSSIAARFGQRHADSERRRAGTRRGRNQEERFAGAAAALSGSSRVIDAPWLLPTQNVTGVVRLSTNTLRTFVGVGRRYSTNRPLFGSSRSMRSLYSPPVHTSPFRSTVTSYGQAPEVGTGHS